MEALKNTSAMRDDGALVFHHPPRFMWKDEPPMLPTDVHHAELYVHVPFCRKICTFCTFERQLLERESIAKFSRLVAKEMRMIRERVDTSTIAVSSLYFGGGTASLLPNHMIETILSTLFGYFDMSNGCEVTLECEPSTKSRRDFEQLRALGVNRISIGVQSFDDDHLPLLNRGHTVRQSREMITAALEAGFENVHIDLMYGLPGQTLDQWRATVQEAVATGVHHISAYRLIVFPSERLARTLLHGGPTIASAEEVDQMRQVVAHALTDAGFDRYSLTEFARDGRRCRYVLSNWDGSNYIGFGPGAYSRLENVLWENTVFHARYEEAIEQGRLPIGKSHRMKASEQLARDLAMGLCLLSVDLREIENRAGAPLPDDICSVLEDGIGKGLLARQGDVVSLTAKGQRYATHVMKQLAA